MYSSYYIFLLEKNIYITEMLKQLNQTDESLLRMPIHIYIFTIK